MNGFVLAALVLPDPTAAQAWAEFQNGFALVTRASEPYLQVRPTDTPDILAKRHRLAQLVNYVDRCWVVVAQNRGTPQDFWNLMQVLRDVADAMSQLSATPAELLACQMAMLSFSEPGAAHQAYLDRWDLHHDPPSHRPQFRAHVELFRENVRRACARWAVATFMPLR